MEEPSDDTPSVTPLRACQLPQRGSREGCVPFIVPPGNRNVAGDFHRPYENSEIFAFHRTTSPSKISRFLTQKRYRVGQGTTVWEPAQSAIKKGGEWANSPPEKITQTVSQEGNPDMGQGEPACTGS